MMSFDQKTYQLSLKGLGLDQDRDLDRIRIQQQARVWILIQRIQIRNTEFLYRFVFWRKLLLLKLAFNGSPNDRTLLLFIRLQELYLP
jgi:hypothetical protein